ncbi:Uncharacterised protein [Mycobacteroides abscessus subsp. massiliense]|nr:Uncharacterised protein [Mycobacteroides abscessus subsp. massiliense]
MFLHVQLDALGIAEEAQVPQLIHLVGPDAALTGVLQVPRDVGQ